MNEGVNGHVLVDIGRGERTHNNERCDAFNWNATENGQLVFTHVKVLVNQPNTEDSLELILLEEIAEFLPHRRMRLSTLVGATSTVGRVL